MGILTLLKSLLTLILQTAVFHIYSPLHFPAGVLQPCLAPLMKGPQAPSPEIITISLSTSRVSKLIVIHLRDRKSFPSCHWGAGEVVFKVIESSLSTDDNLLFGEFLMIKYL